MKSNLLVTSIANKNTGIVIVTALTTKRKSPTTNRDSQPPIGRAQPPMGTAQPPIFCIRLVMVSKVKYN